MNNKTYNWCTHHKMCTVHNIDHFVIVNYGKNNTNGKQIQKQCVKGRTKLISSSLATILTEIREAKEEE